MYSIDISEIVIVERVKYKSRSNVCRIETVYGEEYVFVFEKSNDFIDEIESLLWYEENKETSDDDW